MEKLPTEYIEQIPKWDFATLWKMFKLLYPEKKDLEKVKEGIKIKFPVEVILYEKYEEFPKVNKIRVLGHGTIDYYKFLREIEAREDVMREYLLLSYDNGTTKPRIQIDEQY